MLTIYTLNNKVARNSANSKWLSKAPPPLPPIPASTVRVRTNDGNAPNSSYYQTATLVTGTSDVYDIYKNNTNCSRLLYGATNVIEVLGANTSNVTDMSEMFTGCTSLTTVSLFDTSNVTDMSSMFSNCPITTIPLFNTSKVIYMSYAFRGCVAVESGALALYQQASSQSSPPSYHYGTFADCGLDTTTGRAELAQIPYSWR